MTRLPDPAPAERRAAPEWARRYEGRAFPPYGYTADVVALAVDLDARALQGLTVVRGPDGPFAGMEAWPGGFVDELRDESARAAALRELREETGLVPAGWLEELRTYDAIGRDPRQWAGREDGDGGWVRTGARVVSSAFLAVLRAAGDERPAPLPGEDVVAARWRSVYAILPWEDVRGAEGRALVARIAAALDRWARALPRGRREEAAARAAAAFATTDWNEERAPERFRLMLEAGVVEEAWRDRWGTPLPPSGRAPRHGTPLAFDHRLMLADALGRLRGKVKYVPAVLAALLPETFPMRDLHAALEAVSGRPLVLQNVRRLFAATAALVEPTGALEPAAPPSGPRAELLRFRAEHRGARLDPSLRLPWAPLA